MKPIRHCRRAAAAWGAAALAVALSLLVGTVARAGPLAAATSELPPIAFGEGDRAAARAGVAAAAVAELLDAPPLLARDDASRYVTAAFGALETLAPAGELREKSDRVRREFKPREPRFDRERALAGYADLLKSVLDAAPASHRAMFLAGELAQSIAYNARVLREADADRYRSTLAGIANADASAPGLADARARLGKLDAQDWSDSARLATKAVAAILGSAEAVPFPAAPSIWTILVRSRAPAGRAAEHLALDVVWFDGHHQIYAAYPDGDDFSKNGDRLTCVRNHEPGGDTLHATPLVSPLERDYDALATSFERSCAAFNEQRPPYVVADAGDDRFIAALLTAAGLDPKRAMGRSGAR